MLGPARPPTGQCLCSPAHSFSPPPRVCPAAVASELCRHSWSPEQWWGSGDRGRVCRGGIGCRTWSSQRCFGTGTRFSGRHRSTFFHFQSDPDIPADTDTSPIPELCLLSCYYPKQTSSIGIGTRYRWCIGSASSLVKISVSYMNVFPPPHFYKYIIS